MAKSFKSATQPPWRFSSIRMWIINCTLLEIVMSTLETLIIKIQCLLWELFLTNLIPRCFTYGMPQLPYDINNHIINEYVMKFVLEQRRSSTKKRPRRVKESSQYVQRVLWYIITNVPFKVKIKLYTTKWCCKKMVLVNIMQ